MKWLLKWAGWQAYAVFAALALAVVLAWVAQVASLKADISDAKAATAVAEKALSDRIAVEATAIADAVTKARDEEQVKRKTQEVKYEALLKSGNANRVALVGAERRLHQLASSAGSACSEGGANSPEAAGAAPDASPDGLRPEDRKLISGLLQIAGDAKQVAEERNFLASEYIEQCERK